MAMTVEQVRLWTGLESFPLDHPTHDPSFSERLRHEHGWTAPFASRVVHEYRRFLLLAATGETLMVPSDAVDQAWHLHLVDTRAYWKDLCGRVIHKALHHTPSRGGDTEFERHWRAYEATLARYRATFDEEPPKDIWPPPRDRFGAWHQRVDLRNAWVIPKPFPWLKWLVGAAWAALAAIALLAFMGTGLTNAETDIAKGLAVVAMFIVLTSATKDRRRDGGGCGPGLDCATAGGDGGCGGCG